MGRSARIGLESQIMELEPRATPLSPLDKIVDRTAWNIYDIYQWRPYQSEGYDDL